MRKVILLVVGVFVGLNLMGQDAREGRPDIPGDLVINLGTNFFTSAESSFDLKPLNSLSWGIYYSKNISMGNSFSFYPGIGLGLEKYGFENELTLGFDSDNNVVFDSLSNIGDITVKKTQLMVNYIEVPLEIRYFPLKSTDGSGLFVGVGGTLGFRYESHTKYKYEDSLEDNFLVKQRNDYNLNPFRVGAIARVGTRGINAYYRMYFTDLFDSGFGPDGNATAYTIGISINAF
ncbi:MAG: PorT family protein [Flavobacteriales bacterium]|nr:PorT family protein [Flavobacteriales bacterium]